ncbi:hypothetical protein Ade02nite_22400 [Paractinoplanes deccanensis]|uniref:RING-type E3 ubiquitin transferase n=1 Tax=Paractinoplanes deccanensis TaxID=113561 RepID=A0ABQ3Y0R8_9ACTN|nr:hypothetical protein [Actinoplanes deccanensis]GID73599.1 hypothetical protein Ade02nite_22400 [Actinoplanes deccanensis]
MITMEVTGYVALGSFAVAAASLLFSVLDKRKDRHRRIVVEVEQILLLPEIAGFPGSTFGVTLDGAPLDAPRFYVVRATNTGRASLRTADIEQPLTVRVADGRIVQAEAGFLDHPGSPPEVLEGVAVSGSGRAVQAPKTLLNRGNAIQFSLLTVGSTTPPQVSLRATDFKVVPKAERSAGAAWTVAVFTAIGVALALISIL